MTDEETESKHGMDSADKGEGADGSKQADNPGVDEIAGSGGEGDDQGGLGDRTGAAGGGGPTEPEESIGERKQ